MIINKSTSIALTVACLALMTVTTGCIHSMASNEPAAASKPVAASRITKTPEAFPSAMKETFQKNQSDHTSKLSAPPLQDCISETVQNPATATSQDESQPRDVSSSTPKPASTQEEVEHALELCQSAQTLWEKGDLENALAELDTAYSTILRLDVEAYPELNQQKEDIRYMISKRILEIYASRNIIVNGHHGAIPITLNTDVKNEINRLTGPERKFFIQSLCRSGKYRDYIVQELTNAGLPEELSWLPLIESGFKTTALSSARALGLWQFIPSTGYKFGLNRNYYIDERLDPIKSTQAAIAYLKELHSIFGDWATVLAAYNCGEGRVLRIIKEQNINYLDNFWDLYAKLPAETSRYVPRFLATLHIIRNLAEYGITEPAIEPPMDYKTFTITKQIRLKDIAGEIHVSEASLRELNPELRYALLPPDSYQLRIPTQSAELFLSRLDAIKASTLPPPSRYHYHRVKSGDTLSKIAKRYHTNVQSITRANNIRRSDLIVAGKVLKIPTSASGARSGYPDTSSGDVRSETSTYTVKRGDNLWLIARKYNTTTKKIMEASQISSASLHIGQLLKIPAVISIQQMRQTDTYWVKSGDNPFTIAKKYNMSLERLLTLNHLTKSSKIFPGQKLLVE